MSREISFTLPFAMPLLNKTEKMHWSKLRDLKKRCLWEIYSQIPSVAKRTSVMFEKAHVKVDRYSVGNPDYDNVVGGAKRLIDCLFPPRGLRIIPDDGPEFMTSEYNAIRCKRSEQRTVVTITEIKEAD